MSEPIEARAVALALMREALSLLDDELTAAAAHLSHAIAAVEAAPPPSEEPADAG